MTTVINFNFLNFFRSERSVSATSSVRFNVNSGRQGFVHKERPGGDIIDVTPSSVKRADGEFRTPNLPVPASSQLVYNRAGRRSDCFFIKGRYVDTSA